MASIIREESSEDTFVDLQVSSSEQGLVPWVMERVNRWRQYRDTSFKDRWDEYYRIFRGRWHVSDRSRASERSRLVNPALASALEQTVAEMESATFDREAWIDVSDDDRDSDDVIAARDRLLFDLGDVEAQDAVTETYLNGALYGELIMKLVVEPKAERGLAREDDGSLTVVENDRVVVRWEPLEASEFVPDPSGRTIDEMLGCAHEVLRPLSWVHRQQAKGVFDDAPVHSWAGGTDPEGGDKQAARMDHEQHISDEDAVMITEYHGLVPEHLLPENNEERKSAVQAQLDELIDEQASRNEDGSKMVEAIVTIANKGTLLKAVRNPFIMQDRGFVAAQFEKVSGRFWGRGVMEKGYNPHKALDAELRARIDALALISNPMMGADITRLPRGFDLRVRPGKTWVTNGAPKDVLQPVQFQGLEPATFSQSSELERMVNNATGAMDMNQMTGGSQQGMGRPNASHSSMIMGSFIKRSRRAMQSVSRKFLEPLVKKTLWRYMQFEPQRYSQDYQFRVRATMGIMAREFEQTQMTQLMGQIPDEMSGPKLLLLQSVIENSSSTVKGPLLDSIKQELEQMNSPEAQQARQRAQQLAEAERVAEIQKTASEGALNEARIERELAQAYGALIEAGLEDERLTLDAIKTAIENRRTELLEEQNEIAGYDSVTARLQAVTKANEGKSDA